MVLFLCKKYYVYEAGVVRIYYCVTYGVGALRTTFLLFEGGGFLWLANA